VFIKYGVSWIHRILDLLQMIFRLKDYSLLMVRTYTSSLESMDHMVNNYVLLQ